jgi:phosphoglycolate phosphatase
VPDEERALAQRLKINLTLWPARPLTGLGDDVAGTVDYAQVAIACRQIAAAHPRKLIETLAEDLLDGVLTNFPVARATIEVEKMILPDTDFVRVCLTKSRTQG